VPASTSRRTAARLLCTAVVLAFAAATCTVAIPRASAQITNESPPPGYPPSGCDYDQRGNYYCWGNRAGTNTPVDRYTAIALSPTTMVSGTSHGQTSQSIAEQLALTNCRTRASDCKVVMWGVNSCVGVAVSLPDRTWGASWSANRATAGANALAICVQDKGKSCAVQATPCASDNPSLPAPPPPLLPGPGDLAIVGCYQWFNGASVAVEPNHAAVAGPFTATWQLVNAAQRLYTITWPQPVISRETISPDQRSLSGGSQYGGVDAATRLTGTSGLVGTWNWDGVLTVTVNANGTYSVASSSLKWHGTWQAVAGSPGAYVLTGSDLPTDRVALAADGSRLAGADQYGIAISGTRTDSCAAN